MSEWDSSSTSICKMLKIKTNVFIRAELFLLWNGLFRWKYYDDSSNSGDSNDQSQNFEAVAFSHKKITLEGLTCHSDIFNGKKHLEQLQTLLFQQQHEGSESGEDDGEEEEEEAAAPVRTVQVGKFSGLHEIKLQVKLNESLAGPQVEIIRNHRFNFQY